MRRGEKKAGKRKLEMAGNGEGREKKEGRDGERKRGKGRGRKGRGVEEGEAKWSSTHSGWNKKRQNNYRLKVARGTCIISHESVDIRCAWLGGKSEKEEQGGYKRTRINWRLVEIIFNYHGRHTHVHTLCNTCTRTVEYYNINRPYENLSADRSKCENNYAQCSLKFLSYAIRVWNRSPSRSREKYTFLRPFFFLFQSFNNLSIFLKTCRPLQHLRVISHEIDEP